MKINNKLIRSFKSCYDPSEVNIPENESLEPDEWVEKYRNIVKNKEDIIWLICRNEFLTDRELRLFAVWCAREALKLIENPDHRSVNACDVSERFANGNATIEELDAAWAAAMAAAMDAARDAAWAAARDAARDAARAAARDAARAAARDAAMAAARAAARDAARDAQIDQLIIVLKDHK